VATPVAIYQGNDSGGTGSCNTPPTPLAGASSGARQVFVNQKPVMVNGDQLNPANGTTSNGSPCVSQRTVVATGNVYVNKQPLAKVGDTLNSTNNIKITTGASNVFVV
jgi:uncharacterized Zn-binding protein involved in type VI secretion